MLIEETHEGRKAVRKCEPVVVVHDFDIVALCGIKAGIPVGRRAVRRVMTEIVHGKAKARRLRPDRLLHGPGPGIIGHDDFKVRIRLLLDGAEQFLNALRVFVSGDADADLRHSILPGRTARTI